MDAIKNVQHPRIARRIRAQAQPQCNRGHLFWCYRDGKPRYLSTLFQHVLVLFVCHGHRMAQTVLAVTVRGGGFVRPATFRGALAR